MHLPIPGSDISPISNPEFFGNTMVVNGRTWPVLEVEPRRYRFRFLNGGNSRFLILKIVSDPLARHIVEHEDNEMMRPYRIGS